MADAETRTLRVALTVGQATFEADGDPDIVRELYEEFKAKVWPNLESAAAAKRRMNRKGGIRSREETEIEEGELQDIPQDEAAVAQQAMALPLGGFVKTFNPSTNAQRAALLATWLTHHEDMNTVTVSDIETAFDKTRWSTPTNVSRDMSTAATDGLLKKEGHAEYSLTDYGQRELDKLQAE